MMSVSSYSVWLIGLLFTVGCTAQQPIRDRQKGALIGKLKTFQHEVEGTVWAIDEDVIFIENFFYDGRGPDAFFWMGNESQPSPRGFIVAYPVGTPVSNQKELRRFQGENVILRLPPGQKISGLKYLSVWCRRFTVDFGHVLFPSNLDTPKKLVLPEFKRLAHSVRSGNVTILDAKTFYIPNLHYDGTGPDAFFWVGKGVPNTNGQKIPNEIGSYDVLKGYDGVDIEIQLPDNLTVYDIDYLSIWCIAFRHDFGHVLIPDASELWVPPALGQTRIKPQKMGETSLANCRPINEDFQVEWQASNHDVQIRLIGRIDPDQYMGFGLSPDQDRPVMIDGDIVVVYYDSSDGSFHADDYTLSRKAQCDGSLGVCPDERIRGVNDVTVIGGERSNGVTSVTYSRPYEASDRSDISISKTSEKVTIIAAIGPLNSRKEANYHTTFSTKELIQIDFASANENTCTPLVTGADEENVEYKPWKPNVIQGTNNFSITLGPTGGDRGYSAITGNPSWGYALWVNDLLIPTIHVERGQTYHFTIESGDDENNPANDHPVYITESIDGGFKQMTPDEQRNERVFAGVSYSKMGNPEPTAYGRLCEWKSKGTVDSWRESETFMDYQKTLNKACKPGLPGSLTWTVMDDTPDVVYYQCYTHRNLGWEIRVHDRGTNLPASGAPKSFYSMWLIFLVGGLLLR